MTSEPHIAATRIGVFNFQNCWAEMRAKVASELRKGIMKARVRVRSKETELRLPISEMEFSRGSLLLSIRSSTPIHSFSATSSTDYNSLGVFIGADASFIYPSRLKFKLPGFC